MKRGSFNQLALPISVEAPPSTLLGLAAYIFQRITRKKRIEGKLFLKTHLKNYLPNNLGFVCYLV